MGHHTKFFWQGCSSTEKPVVMPKGCQSMGFAEKTLSGRRQKIKCRDRCLWDPSNKTPETLFTLGDLPEAKGSRSGAYSPHTLEVEGEQSRAILWGWNIWPHHLSCPSVPLRDSILTGEFGLCIPGCSGLDLQIQQLNPIKVLSLGPPPLPMPTHVTKLLRMQEAHFRNQWLAQKWNDRCTGQPKKKLHWFGGCPLFSKNGTICSFCLWVQLTYMCTPTANKIFRNAAEGPHILPNTGISVLRNDTEACAPHPKVWTQHWHTQRDLCNQRRAAYPHLMGN